MRGYKFARVGTVHKLRHAKEKSFKSKLVNFLSIFLAKIHQICYINYVFYQVNVGYASDVMLMSYTHTGEPGFSLYIVSS